MLDLVERARQGDRDAFGLVAEQTIDRMYALAIRVLRDPIQAEDAVQAAFLRAWRDLRSLRDATRFDAWLRRLLIRSCFVEAGNQRAFRARVQLLPVEPSQSDGSSRRADRDQLDRALGKLSLDQRAVVTLHHYVGLPLTDVAETLGIPVGTARSRLHYALQSLRAAVEADERVTVPEGRIA